MSHGWVFHLYVSFLLFFLSFFFFLSVTHLSVKPFLSLTPLPHMSRHSLTLTGHSVNKHSCCTQTHTHTHTSARIPHYLTLLQAFESKGIKDFQCLT